MPGVSIILPCYNAAQTLGRCVDSLLAQTFSDIELLLIDDGSTDASGDIAEAYVRRDARVRVMHLPKVGVAGARNRGIDAATGDYIGFADADDRVEPAMYDALYGAAMRHQAQIALCNYVQDHHAAGAGKVVRHPLCYACLCTRTEIEQWVLRTFSNNDNAGFIPLWSKLYHREWVLANGLRMDEHPGFGTDWWFNMEAFAQADRVVGVPGAYYHYLIYPHSISHKYLADRFKHIGAGRERLLKVLAQAGMLERYPEMRAEMNARYLSEAVQCALTEMRQPRQQVENIAQATAILGHNEVQQAARELPSVSWKLALIAGMLARCQVAPVVWMLRLSAAFSTLR